MSFLDGSLGLTDRLRCAAHRRGSTRLDGAPARRLSVLSPPSSRDENTHQNEVNDLAQAARDTIVPDLEASQRFWMWQFVVVLLIAAIAWGGTFLEGRFVSDNCAALRDFQHHTRSHPRTSSLSSTSSADGSPGGSSTQNVDVREQFLWRSIATTPTLVCEPFLQMQLSIVVYGIMSVVTGFLMSMYAAHLDAISLVSCGLVSVYAEIVSNLLERQEHQCGERGGVESRRCPAGEGGVQADDHKIVAGLRAPLRRDRASQFSVENGEVIGRGMREVEAGDGQVRGGSGGNWNSSGGPSGDLAVTCLVLDAANCDERGGKNSSGHSRTSVSIGDMAEVAASAQTVYDQHEENAKPPSNSKAFCVSGRSDGSVSFSSSSSPPLLPTLLSMSNTTPSPSSRRKKCEDEPSGVFVCSSFNEDHVELPRNATIYSGSASSARRASFEADSTIIRAMYHDLLDFETYLCVAVRNVARHISLRPILLVSVGVCLGGMCSVMENYAMEVRAVDTRVKAIHRRLMYMTALPSLWAFWLSVRMFWMLARPYELFGQLIIDGMNHGMMVGCFLFDHQHRHS